ncbi:hypothetical protein MUDAN_DOGOELCO_01514 [Lactiplantibacillus mudanjiangensis]|nr:hypothetical protein MUDAN_DOGOELCO_01514 [Lactiplantibacillus mudanjiangensis]
MYEYINNRGYRTLINVKNIGSLARINGNFNSINFDGNDSWAHQLDKWYF